MAGRAPSPDPVNRHGSPRHSPLLAAAWVGGGVVGLGIMACIFMVICVQCRLEGLHVEVDQLRELLLSRGSGAAGIRGTPKEEQVRARPGCMGWGSVWETVGLGF